MDGGSLVVVEGVFSEAGEGDYDTAVAEVKDRCSCRTVVRKAREVEAIPAYKPRGVRGVKSCRLENVAEGCKQIRHHYRIRQSSRFWCYLGGATDRQRSRSVIRRLYKTSAPPVRLRMAFDSDISTVR